MSKGSKHACCVLALEQVCNLQGTVKQTLMLEAQHGKATCLHLNGEFLAACTSHQYIKLWKDSNDY